MIPGYQDTVHSYRPSIPTTYQYHLKPGESFYKDRNGKVTIIHSKNEQVSKDTRNDWQKQQDSKKASDIRKQKQMNQAEHKTVQLASNILDRVRPSKLATAVVKGQKPMDYVDNGNEGTGNEIVNTAFDIISTLGTNALFNMSKLPSLKQINLLTKATEESSDLGLFNQGRLALMRRYRENPIWETNARAAGLTDQEIETFRNYANGLLSTKRSSEPRVPSLQVLQDTNSYNSYSNITRNPDGSIKRELVLGTGPNSSKYTGVHEGGHMSTMNYNPANERIAFGQLISNEEVKTAIDKLMQNANNLASQLEVDPNKVINLKMILIKRGMTPEQADQTIIKQIQYLKEGQETRARGLAAQEWMSDNHSVEVPQTVDNGVNFFTNKSLRNVWRGIASTVPIIQGYSQMIQNNTQEKQTK